MVKNITLENGGVVLYSTHHRSLRRKNGKANKCENPDCSFVNPKRYEWALLKGKKHSLNKNNYIQLCPSCHRKYDYTEEQSKKRSSSRKGVPSKRKRAVVLNNKIKFESLTFASEQTGVGIGSIHNNIKGLSNKTKKGKWKYYE